jgi:hypothetical protein
MTERLFGCHILVWHYRRVALPSESPVISPEYSGSESTEIFNILPDVGTIPELS